MGAPGVGESAAAEVTDWLEMAMDSEWGRMEVA